MDVCFNRTTEREERMRRRECITLMSGAATWMLTARGIRRRYSYRHNERASHSAKLADSPSEYRVSFWRWQRGRCFGTNLRAAPLRSFAPTSNLRKCRRREIEKAALIKAANMTVE